MTALTSEALVGVVGAGAMGAGIAQIAAAHGHRVILADAQVVSLERARTGMVKTMAREVEKGRLSRRDADGILSRIRYEEGVTPEIMAPCGIVIEAIVEELSAKQVIFRVLEAVVSRDAVLASNTSSLSIAALGGACTHAGRVVGMHFFNPAPLMPLVEIVPALTTATATAQQARMLADSWGKTTVIAADTPGFIVNRIARPFYSESLRIREEGTADCATIDWAMREFGGFRMGPFELMDFIGNDINFAVSKTVFEAMFYDSRYRPTVGQQRMVEAGLLGRKTRRGYYDYRDGAIAPEPVKDPALGRLIFDRVIAMLVNEAVDAVRLRVAAPRDIEISMTQGVNYPKGLLSWGDEIGAATILARLEALRANYGEDRYRPSPLLRQIAQSGGRLLS